MPGPMDYQSGAASSTKGGVRRSIGALADAFKQVAAPGSTAESRKNSALARQGRLSEVSQGPGGDDTGARTAAAWNKAHPLPTMDSHGRQLDSTGQRQIGAMSEQRRKF